LNSNDLLTEAARRILRIRRFEEAATRLGQSGKVPGSLHTSIGQEGAIVGACLALRPDDYMAGTHRSHGHPIGKGANMRGLMAELMGKETGVNRGKGGSMHLADFSVGSVGESSIVGSGIPVAVGAALGARILGQDRVCLCFFGDGASNAGSFHESVNLATIWKLPVIFFCENNLYAVTTPASEMLALPDVASRALAYGIPGVIVDGQDAVAVHDAVTVAAARARAGEGPSLIEAKTYRYDEHAVGAPKWPYRSEEELERWRARDPIFVIRDRLLGDGVMSEAEFDALNGEILDEVADAVAFAESSAFPPPSEAFTHVFSETVSN
jgi:pyruvate dehydrogenase E1 component alpha subunit